MKPTDNDTEMLECTFVVPAYNEEKRIQKLLSEIIGSEHTFLFICDGNDKTADIINDFSTTHPNMNVVCLEYEIRLGKGKAIKEGLRKAGTPYAGYLDADGSTSFDEMSFLLKEIGQSDGVIGSRYMIGSKMTPPQGLIRRLESRTFNLIVRLLFDLPYADTQCGAKIFKKSSVENVLPKINSNGFEFDVEIIWRMKQSGFILKEIPIIWQNMGDSRVKGLDAFSMLSNILKLRFEKKQI